MILRRFDPLSCSLKRVHADIFMLALKTHSHLPWCIAVEFLVLAAEKSVSIWTVFSCFDLKIDSLGRQGIVKSVLGDLSGIPRSLVDWFAIWIMPPKRKTVGRLEVNAVWSYGSDNQFIIPGMRGRISWDMEVGLLASLLRFCYIELQFRLHNFAGPGVTIYKAS